MEHFGCLLGGKVRVSLLLRLRLRGYGFSRQRCNMRSLGLLGAWTQRSKLVLLEVFGRVFVAYQRIAAEPRLVVVISRVTSLRNSID